MTRLLMIMLCVTVLTSCASTTSPTTTVVYDEHGRPWMTGTGNASSLRLQPPADPSANGWDVLRAIAAIPILGSLAILSTAYGPSSYGVHCRSWAYRDQYYTNCY